MCNGLSLHRAATTADAPHHFRGLAKMTLPRNNRINGDKNPDIFRYGKWGKSLAGVGRWGLLSQEKGAFFAPRGPKSP